MEVKKMESYCVAPNCAFVAEKDSNLCCVHNGTAITDRYNFVVWQHGENKDYCHDCKSYGHTLTIKDKKAICEKGHTQ